LLRALPGGYPISVALHALPPQNPLHQFHELEWHQLEKVFCRDVAPELARFTVDDPIHPLSITYGSSKDMGIDPNGGSRPTSQMPSVAELVRNDPRDDASDVVEANFNRPRPTTVWSEIVSYSPGGRLTARWYPASVYREAWQTLQNDVVKVVAYSLAAAEYRLVALAGHEFVVETPDGIDESQVETAVSQICRDAAAMLLDNARDVYAKILAARSAPS
jgi:hypothetical protein